MQNSEGSFLRSHHDDTLRSVVQIFNAILQEGGPRVETTVKTVKKQPRLLSTRWLADMVHHSVHRLSHFFQKDYNLRGQILQEKMQEHNS